MYNQYIYSLLFTAIITFILAVFLSFQKTYRNLIKITFVAYCVCLVVWSSGQLLALQEKNYDLSLFFVRNYCHSGVIFIPVLFIHFIFCFLEEDFDRRKLIYSLYVIGGVVFFINQFTNLLVKAVDFYPPVFNYVFVPGILHPIYVAFFVFCAVWGNVLLYKAYCKSRGIRRNQIKYLLFAVFLSYLGGTPNFLLGYHIQVKILNPYGTYLLPVFVSIVTYAIIKYHLMDIRLAITQTGIFIAVYSIVLGVPFWLGFKYGVWQHSTWIMFLLATAGPIIYSYLKNHAEKRLLVDQNIISGF